tara:strand:+ start:232 stop:483 length:252 start_codon:yes stop_codon:yes gene_type:complete
MNYTYYTEAVYVTLIVSPEVTILSPTVKAPTEYNVLDVSPLVLLLATKAPPIVAVALIEKETAELVALLPLEAAEKATAGRVD